MDICACIFQGVFSHDTKAQILELWYEETISCKPISTLVFVMETLNNAIYIQNIVNPILLPFLE